MKRVLLGICSIGLLSACSSPAIKDTSLIEQAAINIVESGQQDIQATIESARNLQIEAQQADLYYYSPKHMVQAEQEMAKAEEAYKLKKSDQEILTHSLTAKTLFERGLKIKPLVEQHLKPSFEALEMLKELKAHIILKDDFADLENEVKDLIILIEEDNLTKAIQEQLELKPEVTKLEIATLKATYLIPAELALEKADDAEADDYAQKTFTTAEKSVEKLGLLIDTQYQNRQLIIDTSKSTVHQCQHAENIAKAVKPLLKLNPESGEQHVLFIESLLSRISSALDQDAQNHLTLNKQSISLAQKVETLNKQAQTNLNNPSWAQEKSELQSTIEQLQVQLATKDSEINQIQTQLTAAQQLKPELSQPASSEEKSAIAQQELKASTEQEVKLDPAATANTAKQSPSEEQPLAQEQQASPELQVATDQQPIQAEAESQPVPAQAPTKTAEVIVEAPTEITEENTEQAEVQIVEVATEAETPAEEIVTETEVVTESITEASETQAAESVEVSNTTQTSAEVVTP